MEWPRLSVVVPNYNHGAYLSKSLGAIFNQSAPAFEVIVVDDGSTDNSLEVLAQLASRHPGLRVLKHERNMGVVAAMNNGLENSRGDYLLFASADDEVIPGLFEKSLQLLAEHPQAAISSTISTWHDVASGLSWQMGARISDRPCFLSPDDLVRLGRQGRLSICSSGAIIRRDALNEVGRFIPELRWHCDWFVTYTCAFRYGLCFIPEPLSDLYLHETSYYHRGRKGPEHKKVLEDLLERLCSPAFADIRPRIRQSAVLALFEWPVVRLMIERTEFRPFISGALLWRSLWRSAELLGQRILPPPLKRLCLRLLYRHKPRTHN